jgi:hypothetical protein
MTRRRGKGDYYGGSTIVRAGDYGFGRLDEESGGSKSEPIVTPLMAAAQKRSDRLLAKLISKRRKIDRKGRKLNKAKRH